MKRNYIAPTLNIVRIDAAPILQTSPVVLGVFDTDIDPADDEGDLDNLFDFH